jgi:hypothetical protein
LDEENTGEEGAEEHRSACVVGSTGDAELAILRE